MGEKHLVTVVRDLKEFAKVQRASISGEAQVQIHGEEKGLPKGSWENENSRLMFPEMRSNGVIINKELNSTLTQCGTDHEIWIFQFSDNFQGQRSTLTRHATHSAEAVSGRQLLQLVLWLPEVQGGMSAHAHT